MNKKHIYIASLITVGILALGSISHAYALFTLPASEASFNVSQAKTYYLKGNFNDWSASPEDILNDVTATMGEEEHKVAEYTITKALEINKVLKIWDSSNCWCEQGVDDCSYVDKWSRSVFDEDNNYVVPMTATYDIYLKFYDTGDKQVYITAADIDTLYLKPSANWLSDGARFAAYFYKDGGDAWFDMTADGDYFKVAIPDGYNKVIFCRMDPATTENIWGNKWNQTADLDFSVFTYKNVYELPSSGWDDFNNDYWGSK